MTTYVRRTPAKRDLLAAAATSLVVAAGVGAATFYLARILLSRDELVPGRGTAVVRDPRGGSLPAPAGDQESRDAPGA